MKSDVINLTTLNDLKKQHLRINQQKQKFHSENKKYIQINDQPTHLLQNQKNLFTDNKNNIFQSQNSPTSIHYHKNNQNNKRIYITPRKNQSIQQVREKIMINKAIQGVLTLGRMERMKYVTINNKALFNQGKIKRLQWMNKKPNQIKNQNSFLPDLKSLKVQQSSPQYKNKNFNITPFHSNSKSQGLKNSQNNSLTPSFKFKTMPIKIEDNQYQKLIEQFIQRIKKQNLLSKFNTRQELVEQACKQIRVKMTKIIELKQKQKIQAQSMGVIKNSEHIQSQLNRISVPEIFDQKNQQQNLIKERRKKRSVTQITYDTQIQKVIFYKKIFRLIKTNNIKIEQDKIIKRCFQEESNLFQSKTKEIKLNIELNQKKQIKTLTLIFLKLYIYHLKILFNYQKYQYYDFKIFPQQLGFTQIIFLNVFIKEYNLIYYNK